MIVHELIGTETLFAGQLKEGYYVIREKYNKLDVQPQDVDSFQQIDCGTEDIITVVFDPGNDYSLICLDTYTFQSKFPSLSELQQTLKTKHEDLFQ
ncbi:hypothetical protein [Parageobacillus thermoglucosidasius]|uniref:Uncharacterized protein n=3 Tax=Anoxybacillaceae TaxID=3120669 RepID=A0AAN0YNE9_PARTM|nr:hypothetical protein [Parageobacillus thermoglucosidasius]KYD14577.1 hypothetical protein B4168_1786 [Anoxybacillus flavithermus]REK53176.1 MAG: hypothetical protein C6P36_17560 [Geobacillus sp.]AEH48404.1 hypothetical protein Geoth_2503 [Parageobacillus thermoglucosidasius C56-YS93]ALF10346.1 hypothetical protein AOT13_10125 [Parageobacillus thermoglucosidasius]ANZ30427.1 hypothetical protein BCV53_10135 [Parageobacillus thermoglucosidasius]